MLAWMGPMQAQELAYAKWAIAQRCAESALVTEAVVARAFADGAIVRTHLLRPTWHFVAAEDLRWLLRVSAPRVHALNAYQARKLELDATTLSKSMDVIARSLEGGVYCTRDMLAEALARGGVVAAGHRLAYVMMHAELEALVCSGPMQGKQQTYALVDERVPKVAGELTGDEALAALTVRYFRARGPATAKDYATWASLTLGDARRGIALVEKLERREVSGRTYFAFGEGAPERGAPEVRLVQGYDEIIMSYSESKDVLFAGAPRAPVLTKGPAAFMHAILAQGRVIGHWRHTLEKKRVRVETKAY
ncbi:MAG: winged helix DNA-binding domain-containing protein, partial [Polyangiaceae bacterium]|nr:winged helix DNA-binding domain-containing protein [Polyangiaceae bacterium]